MLSAFATVIFLQSGYVAGNTTQPPFQHISKWRLNCKTPFRAARSSMKPRLVIMRAYRFVLLALLVLTFAFLLRASIPQVATGTWQAGNAMGEPRSGAASVLLSDGSVFITGGDGASGPQNTAELMTNGGAFSSAASMQTARSGHAAIVLQDGRVLVTGGKTTGGGVTNSAELYDPTAKAWTAASSAMLEPRSGHRAWRMAACSSSAALTAPMPWRQLIYSTRLTTQSLPLLTFPARG